MIDFPCKCGHRFSVAEDQAGASLQCPGCGRLVDVPLLSDLEALDEDGTFKLSEQPAPTPAPLPAYEKAYARVRDESAEYDLRPTFDEVKSAGAAAEKDSTRDDLHSQKPKYDPETGELIKPMDIQPGAPVPVIPVGPPSPSLGYANRATPVIRDRFNLRWLFWPANLVVLVFICFFDFVGHMVVASVFVLKLLTVFFVAVILAHYGNVVVEIGPDNHDELPRPLRDLEWGEDVFAPMLKVLAALAICFGPCLLVNPQVLGTHLFFISNPAISADPTLWQYLVSLMLFPLGAYLLPAMLLTLLTSGSIENLRPDRVLGVVKAAGRQYWILAAWSLLATTIYFWNMFGASWFPHWSRLRLNNFVLFLDGPIAFPVLLPLAALVAHLFCWHLGLTYREFQPKFPWVHQFHEHTKLRERVRRAPARPNQRSHAPNANPNTRYMR